MNVTVGVGVTVKKGVETTLSLTHIGRELTVGVGRPWGCYTVNIQLFNKSDVQFQLDACLCADDELIVDRDAFVFAMNDHNLEQVEANVAERSMLSVFLRPSGKKKRFELVFLMSIKEDDKTIWVGEYFVENFDSSSWVSDYFDVDINMIVHA